MKMIFLTIQKYLLIQSYLKYVLWNEDVLGPSYSTTDYRNGDLLKIMQIFLEMQETPDCLNIPTLQT